MNRRMIRNLMSGGLITALLAGVGCMNQERRRVGQSYPSIALPAPGTVPTALNMVSLPEYVIEPPDALLIEVVIRNVKEDTDLKKLNDDLRLTNEELQKKDLKADKKKELEAEKAKIEVDRQKRIDAGPEYDGTVRDVPYQPVRNSSFQVQPDGFVHLGVYGSIPVSGLTLNQARQAIRSAIARQIEPESGGLKEERLLVVASVTEYNSKVYFVHTDGGGNGEQMFKFPVTGKECVSDAIANIRGLPQESSKRNIWVARRTPELSEQQILPVDWVGISQWGVTATDYQLFPGDHVYVKAQRLITVNNRISQILAPVQQLLGASLLGTQTINQISGRGIGFGGTSR
jgi:polysaccharide biosynthesis/export protein